MNNTNCHGGSEKPDSSATSSPLKLMVHHRFERIAEAYPDHLALVCENRKLTYGELNEQANILARRLLNSGVQPDGLVGVMLPKSLEVPVALLAILKAGGAYVPIDPAYPEDRVAYMLEDSRVPFLLTDRTTQRQHDRACRTILVDELVSASPSGAEANPQVIVGSANLAYMIYTSGSTGRPKGVLIEHGGLANVIDCGIRTFGLSVEDRVLHFVSFSFDAATSHLFMALCSGATSVLCNRESFGKDPVGFLRHRGITLAPLPASVLETVPDADLPLLKSVSVGAEACSVELAERWGRRCSFFNMYGPTECTIFVTTWKYRPGYATPPIGRAVPGVEIHILDENLQAVPTGAVGELHIGGVQLARGYHNQPELTEEKFIPNPFGEGRLYKTGDLGRCLPDGVFEFCGRMDDQVKVNGYRIEPGEIEAALRRSPFVKQAVVMVCEHKLWAFVVPRLSEEALRDTLRAYLSQILPDFMVPSRIFMIVSIPLTPEGKIDRQALSHLGAQETKADDHVPASGYLERALMHIWREVLSIPRVSVLDNFFDMGGDSISAMRIVSQVRSALDVDFPMTMLFDALTIRAFAQELKAQGSPDSLDRSARLFLGE